MSVLFSSDAHYSHENIIRFCNRPYKSVQEMDEALIDNWNARVQPDDVVYLLGDLFFCEASKAKHILHRLNGEKHLVLGNHDKLIRADRSIQRMFAEVHPDLFETSIEGTHVVMCHYPMVTWNRSGRGSYQLHGHCHNNLPFDPTVRRLDVGVDAQGYAPIRWDEIKRKLDKIEPNPAK